MPFEVMSPVGRLVGGSPITGYHDTDEKTGVKLFNDDGSPQMSYMAMLAIDKADPSWNDLYAKLWNEGRSAFPHLFAADGSCHRQDFSWKITDGDGRDKNGKPHAEKTGYAGCMVLKIESKYPFSCYATNNSQITDPDVVYRGCYIRVAMKVTGNNATGNQVPGIKMYPQGLQLVGHGERISGGPDAATLFAQPVTAGYIPAGMSATPLASSAPMPGQMPAPQAAPALAPAPQAAPALAPAPQAAPALAPAPQAAPALAPAPQAAPALAPAPNLAFVNNALGVAPAPQYHLTAQGQAQGFTIDQWLAQGYDHATLIAGGIIVQAA